MNNYDKQLREALQQIAAHESLIEQEFGTLDPDLIHRNKKEWRARVDSLKRRHLARIAEIKKDYVAWSPRVAPVDTAEFHSFSRLPQEIQDMIWEYLLPDARVVPLLPAERRPGLVSPCAIPSLLHVCQGSRDLAQRNGYELAFGIPGGSGRGSLYFNFSLDIAFINNTRVLWDAFSDMRKVKHMALGLSLSKSYDCIIASGLGVKNFFVAEVMSDRFCRFGDIDMVEIDEELVPYLGRQYKKLKRTIKENRRSAIAALDGTRCRVKGIGCFVVTNNYLRRWMSERVKAKWDMEFRDSLRQFGLEYEMDPEQVLTIAKAKVARFDSICHCCNVEYATEAFSAFKAIAGAEEYRKFYLVRHNARNWWAF